MQAKRKFDAQFMQDVYEVPMEVLDLPLGSAPRPTSRPVPLAAIWRGCRIGFDAGGSDRKVSAVVDGQTVYSKRWSGIPKTQGGPPVPF